MNLDHHKFFIGGMDFFSILLPSSLFTYLLMSEAGLVVLGNRHSALTNAEARAALLFGSYLSCHLLVLLGS